MTIAQPNQNINADLNQGACGLRVRHFVAQTIASDLFGTADIEMAVGDDGVVPGFAFDRFEAGKFLVFVGVCGDQDDFTFIRDHEQDRLIFEQKDLATAVSAIFPTLLAGIQIDADHDASVEAVDRVAVDDEVVEIRLQLVGDPFFFVRPRPVVVPNIEHDGADVWAGVEKDPVLVDDAGLGRARNAGIARCSRMVPERLA